MNNFKWPLNNSSFNLLDRIKISRFILNKANFWTQGKYVKQFEDKFMDKIQKEMKKGKLEVEVKEISLRMFREFYQFMWMNRSYWEPRLKNA